MLINGDGGSKEITIRQNTTLNVTCAHDSPKIYGLMTFSIVHDLDKYHHPNTTTTTFANYIQYVVGKAECTDYRTYVCIDELGDKMRRSVVVKNCDITTDRMVDYTVSHRLGIVAAMMITIAVTLITILLTLIIYFVSTPSGPYKLKRRRPRNTDSSSTEALLQRSENCRQFPKKMA